MVEAPTILAIGFSARALAVAAKRAGHAVVAADLFGDTDLKSAVEKCVTVEGDPVRGFDPEALLSAAEVLAPRRSALGFGLVYGAGFEAQPDLLERLCRGRRLYGNRPETVARLKSPAEFFPALDRLGIPHPQVDLGQPDDGKGWLVKGIGGSGGEQVRPYTGVPACPGNYYQRMAPGRPIGVSFLADGRRSLVIGCNEQVHAGGSDSVPFRFGGAVQPTAIGKRLGTDMQELLDAVTVEFGLVGLNNLDLMDDNDAYAVLEVNPRPGANLDIFDHAECGGLFSHHISACEGQLPKVWAPPPGATATAVVYAANPSRVPADMDWPEWVADRPAPGTHIDQGAPICTVLATSGAAAAARRLAAKRVSRVLSLLRTDEPQPGRDCQPQLATASAGHA